MATPDKHYDAGPRKMPQGDEWMSVATRIIHQNQKTDQRGKSLHYFGAGKTDIRMHWETQQGLKGENLKLSLGSAEMEAGI